MRGGRAPERLPSDLGRGDPLVPLPWMRRLGRRIATGRALLIGLTLTATATLPAGFGTTGRAGAGAAGVADLAGDFGAGTGLDVTGAAALAGLPGAGFLAGAATGAGLAGTALAETGCGAGFAAGFATDLGAVLLAATFFAGALVAGTAFFGAALAAFAGLAGAFTAFEGDEPPAQRVGFWRCLHHQSLAAPERTAPMTSSSAPSIARRMVEPTPTASAACTGVSTAISLPRQTLTTPIGCPCSIGARTGPL